MDRVRDASWQRLGAAAAATDQQARRLLHIQAAMDGVDVVAGSTDGAVRVSVDRNGALTDIGFADGAMRLGPAGLAAAVMAATREAKTRIGPRYAEIVRSSGADEATADHMIGRYLAHGVICQPAGMLMEDIQQAITDSISHGLERAGRLDRRRTQRLPDHGLGDHGQDHVLPAGRGGPARQRRT